MSAVKRMVVITESLYHKLTKDSSEKKDKDKVFHNIRKGNEGLDNMRKKRKKTTQATQTTQATATGENNRDSGSNNDDDDDEDDDNNVGDWDNYGINRLYDYEGNYGRPDQLIDDLPEIGERVEQDTYYMPPARQRQARLVSPASIPEASPPRTPPLPPPVAHRRENSPDLPRGHNAARRTVTLTPKGSRAPDLPSGLFTNEAIARVAPSIDWLQDVPTASQFSDPVSSRTRQDNKNRVIQPPKNQRRK